MTTLDDRPSTGGDSPYEEPAATPPSKSGNYDWVVLGVAGVLTLAFVAWGILDKAGLGGFSTDAQGWVITNTGWFFAVMATLFVIFVLWLATSRYGKIPLGKDGEKPEFKTVSWIAMMFSAGMGIGLMFWGAAEPLSFYLSPPPGSVEAATSDATRTAMATSVFHWTLHPWAIYAVVGLAIAYGTFRKGRSQLISAAFKPIFGRHTDGPAGRIIDIMAIWATLFGSAASLGLGALQIAGGLDTVGWVEGIGKTGAILIIVALTIAFIASAVSGIERGIQWLSNTNMILAIVLAAFVFIAGPTLLILNLIPTTLGEYVLELPEMASRTAVDGAATEEWLGYWTIFYWAWWISWTPFVGMFIARISRGRTIRSFVGGVLLVPSVVSLVWFAIFGGSAIFEQSQNGSVAEADGTVNSELVLFNLLDNYPMAAFASGLVMLLVAIFFVSGADAASIVMGTLSEKGSVHPSKGTVIFWGTAMGAVAAVMLAIGSGDDLGDALAGLQALTIVVALPFAIVMTLLCVSLYRDVSTDPIIMRENKGVVLVESAVVAGDKMPHDEVELVVVEKTDDHRPAQTVAERNGSNGDGSDGSPPQA